MSVTKSKHSKPALIRGIGAIGIALIVLNSMIGAGIFALPAAVAAKAGDLSPWLFLAIGVLFIRGEAVLSNLAGHFGCGLELPTGQLRVGVKMQKKILKSRIIIMRNSIS